MSGKSNYLLKMIGMLLVLSMTAFVGCSKPAEEELTTEVVDEQDFLDAEDEAELEEELTGEGLDNYVATVEELLEAIAPGAEIVVEAGYYDLSETIAELWEQEGESWNESHPYVRLQECGDGVELVVQNVDGLSIMGQSEDCADVELVNESVEGSVLTFENCGDLFLSNLTLGHTEVGEGTGSVLRFVESKEIVLINLDIYGWGSVGLRADEGSGNINMHDSIIRECTEGPLYIANGVGEFAFNNCILADSDSGGYYEATADSLLGFYDCTLGMEESDYWYSHEDAYSENCEWDEIIYDADDEEEYVDEDEEWEEDTDEFNSENLQAIPFDETILADSFWMGWVMVDAAGAVKYLPEDYLVDGEETDIYMDLWEDGTGTLDGFIPGEYLDFTWTCDSQYSAQLQADGRVFTISLYTDPTEEELWLLLNTEDTKIWFY